jgi:hypothetical protein
MISEPESRLPRVFQLSLMRVPNPKPEISLNFLHLLTKRIPQIIQTQMMF